MILVTKLTRNLLVQISLVFLLSLLGIGLAFQVPFTYRVNIGLAEDSWTVRQGFGDREHNDHFSFRWTTDPQAELRLPDVGWPSRIGLVGVAPRPNNSRPATQIRIKNQAANFNFAPEYASFQPDPFGRLTFEANGPSPHFSLLPHTLFARSEVYKPKGDERTLGIALSQVYVTPRPGRFGLVLPPLTLWLGWAVVMSLLYFNLSTLGLSRPWLSRPRLLALGVSSLALALAIAAQLLVPTWTVVNGGSLTAGLGLALLGWTLAMRVNSLTRRRGNWSFGRLALLGLVVGTLPVYYGLALAPFLLMVYVALGLMCGVLAVRHSFRVHSENLGLLLGSTAGVGWGLWQNLLPRSDDVPHYHLYWINELDRMIAQGNFYPRFAPDFSWGQGGMVFNFYGPLSRYLVEAAHLAGMTFNNGVLLTQFATVGVGVVGTYFWCEELLHDRRAAVLGGLAFCYFPYNISGLFISGALGNSVAGAVLPWVFWLFLRLVQRPTEGRIALWLGIGVALLPLSNDPQALIFVPVASLFLLGLVWLNRKAGWRHWREVALKLGTAAGIALGLSAFFFLPALFDVAQVGMKDAAPASNFFANWPNDLAVWRPIYTNMESFALLGTLHYVLAGLGLVVIGWRRVGHRVERQHLVMLGGLLGLTFFLQWPVSNFVWQAFPIFTSINFSSRLMAPAIVFATPLIAALIARPAWVTEQTMSVDNRPFELEPKFSFRALPGFTSLKKPLLTLGPAIAVAGLMVYASLYSLTYAYWPPTFTGAISQKALTEQIVRGDVVWLPKGLDNYRPFSRYRQPEFEPGQAREQTDRLEWKNTGSDSYELKTSSQGSAHVTVPLFWWSAAWWKVTDETGQEYPTKGNPVNFSMTIEVPPGQHSLRVKFVDTPLRLFSNILSLLTLVSIGVYLAVSLRHKVIQPQAATPLETRETVVQL